MPRSVVFLHGAVSLLRPFSGGDATLSPLILVVVVLKNTKIFPLHPFGWCLFHPPPLGGAAFLHMSLGGDA